MSHRLLFPSLVLVTLAFSSGCRKPSHDPSTSAAGPVTPGQIVAGKQGDLFVNQEGRGRVLKVSSSGKVSVYAGTGEIGSAGDGGPADRAQLISPTSIALDPAGDLFIADTGNKSIRRVDAKTQTITTIADKKYTGSWNGANALHPDGLPAGAVPVAIAADADENVYIGGPNGMGIRQISASSHQPTKVVANGFPGDPSSPFTTVVGPFWLTAGSHGNILYSQADRNIVALINTPLFDVHRLAGDGDCGFAGDGGPALGALLCSPQGIATGMIEGHRVLLIADAGNNRIRMVNFETGTIATVAGNGQAGYAGDGGSAVQAAIHGAMGVALGDDGTIFIADTGNDCIRKVDSNGTITTLVTKADLQ